MNNEGGRIRENQLEQLRAIALAYDRGFSDLLPEIKKRPTLYLSRYSIFDFQSFYYGYDLARNQLGVPKTERDREFEEFLLWVRSRYDIQTTQSWASLILFYSVDERDALDRLFDWWEKFQNRDRSEASKIAG